MYCPKCGHRKTHCIDSRMYPLGINKRRRKYECDNCHYRFHTIETIDPDDKHQWNRHNYKEEMRRRYDN